MGAVPAHCANGLLGRGLRALETVLNEDLFPRDDDLDEWAALLEALESSLPRQLTFTLAEGRARTLSVGAASPKAVVEHFFYGEVGSPRLAERLSARSTYPGRSLEGHALAMLCRELDAWNHLEACQGDDERLRTAYLREGGDSAYIPQANWVLFRHIDLLSRGRLMRVGLALAEDRRAGRAPARSLDALAKRHGFPLPLDPATGEPLAYELREDVVRIAAGAQGSKKSRRVTLDIPR